MRALPRIPVRLRWAYLRKRYGNSAAARRLGMRVGEGCRILSFLVSSEPHLVSIGDRTTVSLEARFITHDGTGWLFHDHEGERYYRYAPIAVGSDCFIGARATIMPGVRIDDRCVVAAGSVVTRSVPAGSVVAGVPARIIGRYEDLGERISSSWPTGAQRRGETYIEQVDSIAERTFTPYLRQPGDLDQ